MFASFAFGATSALVYSRYSRLPQWMRLSTSEQAKLRDADRKDANDDLAHPQAIITKLKEMMTLVAKVRNESDDITEWQKFAAFYSLIHLHTELNLVDPDYRDKQFEDQKHDNLDLNELKELKIGLEYALWAYETSYDIVSANCRAAGLDLLRHDAATEPGRVGHFVAMDHKNKTAIVGLKGTSSLADLLTDLVAVPTEQVFNFDCKTISEGKSIYCHEGMFTAALWIADSLQEFIENMLLPLQYKLLICGHSLGAGTSCLLGLELRSRIPAFRKNYDDLRVMAFATPPVISLEASKACLPFVTSVINNTDVVPRASLGNFVVLSKLVRKVNEKLKAKGHNLGTWLSLRTYYAKEVATVDEDLLLTPQELEMFFAETHSMLEKEPDHLYVPGKCVVMWDKGVNDDNEISGFVTNCRMKMLRTVELCTTMISDHMVPMYFENLARLIGRLEQDK